MPPQNASPHSVSPNKCRQERLSETRTNPIELSVTDLTRCRNEENYVVSRSSSDSRPSLNWQIQSLHHGKLYGRTRHLGSNVCIFHSEILLCNGSRQRRGSMQQNCSGTRTRKLLQVDRLKLSFGQHQPSSPPLPASKATTVDFPVDVFYGDRSLGRTVGESLQASRGCGDGRTATRPVSAAGWDVCRWRCFLRLR